MPPRRNRRRLTDAERDARRHADRERVEQAARAADQRRLAALDPRARHQRPVPLQPAQPVADRMRVPHPGHHPHLHRRLSRLPGPQPLRRRGETAIKILVPVAVKQRDDTGEETGEKRIFFRTVPVFDTLSRVRW